MLKKHFLYNKYSTVKALALPIVVAVILFATAIVVAVVYQLANTTQNRNTLASQQVAQAAVAQVESEFQGQLSINPLFFLHTTFANEDSRNCLTGAVTTPVPGGQPWPAACGTTWTYVNGSTADSVVAEITAPTIQNPHLILVLSANYSSGTLTETYSFVYGGKSLLSIYSGTNFDLNTLAQRGGTATIAGAVYSGGYISLPTSSSVVLAHAQLETPAGFTTNPTDSAQEYFDPTPTSGSLVKPLSSVMGSPLAQTSLESSVDSTINVACSAKDVNLSTNFSSSLCINKGTFLINSSGNQVAIPTNATAYMLEFSQSASNLVTVYTSAASTTPSGFCSITCNSVAMSKTDPSNPALSGYWTKLGDFYYPASGVIATDSTTYVGYCGSNYSTTSATCIAVGSSAPGDTSAYPITVIAGTIQDPHSIYINAPINPYNNAVNIGLVATKNVYIPFFANPPRSSLNISAGIEALGLGNQDTFSPSIIALPTAPNSYSGGALSITGSLIASNLDLSVFSNYSNVSFTSSPVFTVSPTPYWPNFGNSWSVASKVIS